MKSNPKNYLQGILSLLGLSKESSPVSEEVLLRAARFACKNADFSFTNNRISALQPVLETLKGKTSNNWFDFSELTLEKAVFPKKEKPTELTIQNRITAIEKAINPSGENLLNALHFHTSLLAVSEKLTDLPLFDFIKTTAAIAYCIENGNGQLRLAGGSISGIQSYLYDIVSKRASKLLKGRSFYLQLLSDSLAERFLETFGLSDAHIVYSSGGGFYVLMPDSDNVKDDFENFKSTVIKQIYERHGINLTCEFAISDAFDEKGETPKIWDGLLIKLNEAKNQRLSHNSELLKDLLGFVDEGGADDDENSKFTRDTVTNDQILRAEAEAFDEDGNLVHRFTNAQKFLGEDLRDAEFWVSSREKFHKNCFTDPLGYFHLLCVEHPNELPDGAKVQMLNHPRPTANFIFYGGNKIPVNLKTESINGETFYEGDPKTFDQLALGDRLDRLGILRMDVDNLGKIFSEDIGSPASFARYSAVSRSLDWFFKGYLNTIHAEVCAASGQKFSERTVIIYSGGDDLFIVGRWLETLEMSCRIQEDFKLWSGGNLTISGGVAILPDKFPVMQGANLAGEKEKTAKGYCLDNGSETPCKKDETGFRHKNAICFFDHTLNWENEMPVVEDLKKMLEHWLDPKVGGMDASILQKIDQHAQSRKEQEKHGDSPRWIWNMVYDFGRFAQKTKDQLIADNLRELAKKATLEDFEFKQKKRAVPFLYILQTAARWVELERRTLKNDSNP